MADGILDVGVESNLRTILADLKEFDPKLATAVRRKLRQSGDDAIAEMRAVLAEPSPGIVTGTRTAITSRRMDGSIGPRRVRIVEVMTSTSSSGQTRGSRQAIADGLRVRVQTGATRQSIRLTGAGAPFPKSYNMKVWRHPVRFNSNTTTASEVPWVSQGGRPYFGAVLVKRGAQIKSQVYEALDEALAEIARNRTVSTTPIP